MVTHRESSILIVYYVNKTVFGYKEPWMQENGLNQFCTIVSEVSSFVNNPVSIYVKLYSLFVCLFVCPIII